ncbi:MAG: segregation/condensation protein A [Clostridia bacterium]
MVEHIFDYECDIKDSLKLELDNFNGPLDQLLYLVKEAKIEIKDIFLSNVTDQFLKYMAIRSKNLDVDENSEYMEITATLLEIKSRSMLPQLPYEEEETPEQEIIRRLDEFRMLKEASERLKEIENIDRLYKPPTDTGEVNYIAKDMSIENLLNAFAQLLLRMEVNNKGLNIHKNISRDKFTISEKIKYIIDYLQYKAEVSFFEIFDKNVTKNEIIVTFSAMLELMKLQYITVSQKSAFGDIMIIKNMEYNGDGEFNYDDETI